ncbi:hypothetical protein BJX61DRAFT_39268 [Aspergillus egyptiacus]|nr:hypothetical protein BJX61DRAFT_39268 [Aspergillus egyptiacus]
MEAAPLSLAHTHARNAVLETRKSNPVAASEEHDLAAGEFATAAQSTKDREALRTLHLLEQHHKKLAQILRFQHENPPSAAAVGVASAAAGMSPQAPEPGTSKADAQQPPKLSGYSRLPKRETSSIASELASARGIPAIPRRGSPASPTLSAQQAGAKMTDGPGKIRTSESRLRGAQTQQRERTARALGQKQPWSPPVGSPTDITSRQFVPPDAGRPATDEPFQRFYSTVEGLVSKISAPLAFAGLPLGLPLSSDNSNNATAANRKASANTAVDRQTAAPSRTPPSSEPDVSRIFSRAALKAIRDSNEGLGGIGGNPAESFYVVPTTGGTVSYAGILTRAEKEARRSSIDEGDDDFVDARETPSSPEMLQGKGKGKANRGSDKLTSLQPAKTLEELQMENQALRHLSDTLSKRLHMWEVNAQSSSMALQQSLKAIHHQNVPFPEHFPQSASTISSTQSASATPAPTEQDQRIKELEEIIRRTEKELDQAGRENSKLRNTLGRYRDRWEKLKEGAKSRRAEGARNSSAGAAAQNTAAETETVRTSEADQETTSNEPGTKTDAA